MLGRQRRLSCLGLPAAALSAAAGRAEESRDEPVREVQLLRRLRVQRLVLYGCGRGGKKGGKLLRDHPAAGR